MSSDDYFDDELDSAFLNQVDAIEAAHTQPPKQPASEQTRAPPPAGRPATSREVIELSDTDDFDSFDIDLDDAELQRIDEICRTQTGQATSSSLRPIAGPSNTVQRRPSKNAVQTTLFGDPVHEVAAKPRSNGATSLQRTASSSRTQPAGRSRKTKQWDHTQFAKTGWKRRKSIGKGKGKASFEGDDEDEEAMEFEQFPAPFVSVGPPPPMKLVPDLLAARRWLYPLNQPKRDYQFNIVKHCLFENTLVSLPTGLGKTFIAGVVMLNFYTWFPEGKVVFVAPTKPLVAQQIDACHRTCGIPGSHAAELTGETSRIKRSGLWDEKRVFYMTPQTLMSDLTSDNCDPGRIVLLVIDEAHKGSGDYAYAQVVRFMMAKNPHFRVLALTATPGGNPEAVQAIVDALHISHVEIRDEKSMDLHSYMHKKHIQQHCIKLSDELNKIKDLLAAVMQPMIKQLQSNGILHNAEASTLHHFRCRTGMGEIKTKRAPPYLSGFLNRLQPLARAMSYLFEASMEMCYTALHDIATGDSDPKKNSATQKEKAFQTLMSEVRSMKQRGFPLHPKMEKLQELLVQHFAKEMLDKDERTPGQQAADSAAESRAIVFVSFRQCVDEVVELLSHHNPLIRATRFIGQGTDTKGRKGHTQKEQLEIINKFKTGEFNVLVSTSIGEEGLDIGEVDLIVCYDAQKTPIRMLQRVGRTGRKKDGYVHVLLAQGREEHNWAKAQSSYKEVQQFIVRAEHLELYGDVPRLLPEHVKPDCVEMVMEIEEHVREDSSRKRSFAGDDEPNSKAKRRKRDDNPDRNIPAGAANGFVNVKDLIAKGAGAKKRTKKQKEFDILAGESDDDDKEIAAGVFGGRRTLSTSALTETSKTKKKPRRTATMPAKDVTTGSPPKKPKRRKKADVDVVPLADFDRMGEDDEEDAAIEAGLSTALPPSKTSKRRIQSPRTPSPRRKPLPQIKEEDVIDLTTPAPAPPEHVPRSPPSSISLSSSPGQPLKSRSTSTTSGSKHISGNSSTIDIPDSPSSRSGSADHPADNADMSWLIEDDDDPEIRLLSPIRSLTKQSPEQIPRADELFSSPTSPKGELRPQASLDSPTSRQDTLRPDMPPPALPLRFSRPVVAPEDEEPAPSCAIRVPGRQAKKRVAELIDSSPLAMPPPQGRLQRRAGSSSPPPAPQPAARKTKKRKFKDIREAQRLNPWLDVEATHSGDEHSVGSSSDRDGYEKDFVQEDPTQASPSYDQSAVYRRSLLTQAQGGPFFANRPARRGAYAHAGPSRMAAQPMASSSPRDETDEYEFGSFVVDDDAEVSYLSSE